VNYFDLHIGDYEAATAHLSHVEDAIYSRMLRLYYRQEAPLPVSPEVVARLIRSTDQIDVVKAILLEFFTLADDGWHKTRCDEAIAKYREKAGKASNNAKSRWANVKKECERNAGALPTHSERNANQEPITNNQERAKAKGGQLALPDWLSSEAWSDWHAYRNARKGWTPKARELSLRTLTELWATGHDPRAVIHQSIERGWTGLFPVKGQGPPAPAGGESRTLTGMKALQGMKDGLVHSGNDRRADTAHVAVVGSDAPRRLGTDHGRDLD
jgi:uncharacterized protein YdaU (DUF1376 family)